MISISAIDNVHFMAIHIVEFSKGGTKLERFLPKNQHTPRKKLMLSKNVNNKKCAPELIFFNEKKMRKIRIIFDIEN